MNATPTPGGAAAHPGLVSPVLLWRGQTTNRKTGNIPTASVKASHYDTGCIGCPHYGKADTRPEGQRNVSGRTGVTCYAHRGRVRQAARQMNRAAESNPQQYTVHAAMGNRVASARFARLTAIGDVYAAPRAEVEEALAVVAGVGLRPILYTAHWWRQGMQYLSAVGMASVVSDGAHRRALSLGWRVARTVAAGDFVRAVDTGQPVQTEGGDLTPCPAMVAELEHRPAVTCNDCGLCAQGSTADVAFATHGYARKGRAWSQAVKGRR